MPIKQDSRSLGIKTPLGADVLGLRSFSVQEQISRLFQIEAELSSDNGSVDFDKVIGHDVTIRINVGQQSKRYFHGFVSRMVQVANQDAYSHYRATIVPWLWFLTRTSDCRIFQQQSTPDIIEAVFKGHGFSDYQLKLSGNYSPREYCVQYRETDFNFVSRLMEQEGIYYFFDHQDGKHVLVLADSVSAHKPFPGYSEVTFHEAEHGAPIREVVTDWTMEKEVQPVASALQDFDFTKPKSSLLVSTNVSRKYGEAKFEIYDYPGEYIDHGDGQRLADVRLDELQTQYETLHGQANARGLASGSTFKLKNHPRDDQNREYLITGVSLHADAGEFSTAGSGNTKEFFSCNITCIDKSQQFRPARLTPKPVVQGPQTAIVVGPGGEEIYTDAYARVKVHFHWNRHDKSDQDSSCWVRVSQYWAGKTWGSVHIPRLGQEVVVEFLEGDPDRPIITGRIYNADQTPPYALPANKTQSGVKSRSSKGGGSANFNEIRFEDKMGSEEVYIHAEKDQNNVVENNETTQVGHDRKEQVVNNESITIGNNQTNTIGSNRTETVGSNESITIGSNRSESVGGNEGISIGKNRSESVGGGESISIGGARDENVAANESVSIGANRTLSVGSNETKEIGKNETLSIGENRTKTVGKNETISVGENRQEDISGNHASKAGKAYSIEAAEEIVLKTGSATLTMKKDGTISINGKDIDIEGSGKIQVKASSDVVVKGSAISHN